ncbi:flagellar basal body-associated FliL family protein [Sneathiella glossodoripedis]|uniref:flagellar basal body-associated FliL family protein n=1 Tax=Sneathiella glossodoripedis TaxID=418853 RepID=UPI00047108DE|nr:flagellar basal body-associated FliL family protein [Sneathiella glossodoripedis]
MIALFLGFCTVGIYSSDAVAAASEEEGEEVIDEGPFYLELKPLSVPIRKKSGAIRYYMFISMSMEFDDQDKKDYSRKMIPRLRDAFLQDLSGRSVLHKDKSRGVDFEQVKRRLNKQAKKVLGKNAPNGMHVVKVFKGS